MCLRKSGGGDNFHVKNRAGIQMVYTFPSSSHHASNETGE